MRIRMTYPMSCRHEVEVDGRLLRLRPQQHAIVEFLILNPPDCGVSLEQIAQALWGDRRPQSVKSTIHSQVCRLRRLGIQIGRYPDHTYFIDRRVAARELPGRQALGWDRAASRGGQGIGDPFRAVADAQSRAAKPCLPPPVGCT